MSELLKDYKVQIPCDVAWGEMDSFNHVNNIYYFRYFETGRIHYFLKIGLMDHFEKNQIGPILHSTSCRYRRPLTFPDHITIGVRTSALFEDRFVHHYRIVSESQGAIVAEGEATTVTYDYSRLQKAPVPTPVIRAIEKLDGVKLQKRPAR